MLHSILYTIHCTSSVLHAALYIVHYHIRQLKDAQAANALSRQRQKQTQGESALKRMLAEPHATFTIAESIDIISECLEQGNCNANQIRGQEALFVIGNTGAGKSTTVNYLCGCKMQFKMRKELGLVGGGKVCVVIPKKEGGPKDEIMQIGHSNQSQTFLPQIEHDEETGTVYCDCARASSKRVGQKSTLGTL